MNTELKNKLSFLPINFLFTIPIIIVYGSAISIIFKLNNEASYLIAIFIGISDAINNSKLEWLESEIKKLKK